MVRTYKGKCPLCDSEDITSFRYFYKCNSCGYNEKIEENTTSKAYNHESASPKAKALGSKKRKNKRKNIPK